MAEILIIEDEKGVQITLEDRLVSEGYTVSVCGDGIEGENRAKNCSYDLILLDIMLPGRDGFSICQNLRKEGIITPVIMLTARDTNIDTVMGLKVGADDYLAKPFDMTVLLARIEALLRRTSLSQQSLHESSANSSAERNSTGAERIIKFGIFTLDRDCGILKRNDVPIELNAQEYKLLEYLVVNSGKIISRNSILDDVWGYETEISTRTIDVHVAKLRQRIGESERPKHITTYRNRGYKFEINP